MPQPMTAPEIVRAPRGAKLRCRGWHQEAALRMLMNNLDPEVAERPQDLVVYGGRGKAARNWECFRAIVSGLEKLENDETLLIQSGKPVGVFRTHEHSPRVLIANSNLVGKWATWEVFDELEKKGLMMYGQMTAGSWIYIGTQGILQGTYETFAEAARQRFSTKDREGTLEGRLVVTGGLGGMGGAQPLAATMNGAAFLGIEVDPARVEKRLKTGYLDCAETSLDKALALVLEAKKNRQALSVGLVGNCAKLLPEIAKRELPIDILTDQTSAHDPVNGYIPAGLSLSEASQLRTKDPKGYRKRSMESIAIHVKAMLEIMRQGAITFDYGNNIRAMAKEAGVADAFAFPGFVPAFIRPLFCGGNGPFRWAVLSGEPKDIAAIDDAVLRLFPEKKALARWIGMARKKVKFQGLPSRICWLGYGERDKMGLRINEMVRKGEVSAPVVMGRDHLDCGSVASPYRETESMKDGSDAVADWPVLNALLSTASGASWVSFHHGGGVGMGYSLHAGQVTVADGTKAMDERIARVLTNDPGMGIIRHADAGYAEAAQKAKECGVRIPMG